MYELPAEGNDPHCLISVVDITVIVIKVIHQCLAESAFSEKRLVRERDLGCKAIWTSDIAEA